MRWTLSKMPRAAKRKLFHAIPAQYQLIACYAGKTEPVHEKILEALLGAIRGRTSAGRATS